MISQSMVVRIQKAWKFTDVIRYEQNGSLLLSSILVISGVTFGSIYILIFSTINNRSIESIYHME